MAKKSTDAELQIRYATIAEMLIKGQSRQDILQYSSKTWGVCDRTTDEYIARSWTKIKSSVNDDIEKNVALAIARYNDLYKRNFNIQDYRECRQVQGDIVKLLGLNSEKDNSLHQYLEILKDALQPLPETKDDN